VDEKINGGRFALKKEKGGKKHLFNLCGQYYYNVENYGSLDRSSL